ncbi:MAG: uroporphyrinogen-III synthase [Sulfolobus sp.]|nr:uroporphyrinogen-III synthase [Sulfolobus sp.]
MKVLFLRPEGAYVPPHPNFIHIEIVRPVCLPYIIDINNVDALGFTSVNAVECFKDFDKIFNKKLFSVGNSTAEALKKKGFNSIIVPEEYTVKNLVEMIRQKAKNPALIRSQIAIDNRLDITQIADYTLVVNKEKLSLAIKLIENCEVGFVVLTSSFIASLVKDFIKDCEVIISIGPSTSNTLKGKKIIYEAKEHDMKGILNLLKDLGVYDE